MDWSLDSIRGIRNRGSKRGVAAGGAVRSTLEKDDAMESDAVGGTSKAAGGPMAATEETWTVAGWTCTAAGTGAARLVASSGN